MYHYMAMFLNRKQGINIMNKRVCIKGEVHADTGAKLSVKQHGEFKWWVNCVVTPITSSIFQMEAF